MSLEETVRELDALELDAVLRRDVERLAWIWSEDYVVTPPDNVPKHRSEVLDLVKAGLIDYSETHRTVEHVRARDGVAITLGHETFMPVVDSGRTPKPLRRRFTHVWVDSPGGWRLLARHANLIEPAVSAAAALDEPRMR